MLLPIYPKIERPTLKRLCCYVNSTHKMQLVKVSNRDSRKLEKVVFPRQRFLFEAMPNNKLEVYIEQEGKKILKEAITCKCLQIE